jgi:hypothetical protein
LPIATKTITDDYTQQSVVTTYKVLRSYDHFKQVIKELIEPKNSVTSALFEYQDIFNKSWEEDLSAHFLRYAILAANLTQKMSELEIIDAIGGHYPN